MRLLTRLPFAIIFILPFCQIAHAEEGVLWARVSNPLNQPIPGVVLSAAGRSSGRGHKSQQPSFAIYKAGEVCRSRTAAYARQSNQSQAEVDKRWNDVV
jgi:hypothetical protein